MNKSTYKGDNEYGDRELGDNGYWWNLSINTTQKVQHNKPDLVIGIQKRKRVISLKLVVLLILTSLRKKRKNRQLMYH